MTLGEAVVKRIDELLFEKGWSLYKLSKDACLPLSTLKNLYRNHTKSPTLALIYKIANAFNLTPIQFLDSSILQNENIDVD